MKIIRTSHIDSRQLEDIHTLEAACQSHDQTALTFPTEDGCLSFLLYDEETLLSAFSAFFNENETCSCSAFTHPAFRRRGLFTRLLEEFLKESGEYDLLFLADDTCQDALHTLKALGAELLNREHMMKLMLSDTLCEPAGQTADYIPPLHYRTGDTRYTIVENGVQAGFFHLIFQDDSVYFYGFEIQESLRNQGLGTRVMTGLLNSLAHIAEGKLNHVLLQVSGSNTKALALYKKLGFEITETLSYYLY